MIGLFTRLEEIEEAKGSKAKKEILKQAILVSEYKAVLEKALDPRFPMYLGREAKFESIDPDIDGHFEPSNLVIVMDNLHNELIGRGAPAHKTVNEFIGGCEDQEMAMKWIPRLFTKDLQIGVSWETFTKATDTKKFAVMLAKPLRNIKKLEEKYIFPVYIQPKLDGYRGISNTEGEHELRSRNGNEYENFPTIVEALKEVCPEYMLLDGEVMSDDFQSMQKTAFRKDGETVGDVRFHVFDCITREEWDAREGKFSFTERQDSLVNLLESHPLIKIVETIECHSWEEVYEHHDRYMKEGYEGTMVRADKPYQFKRTDFLSKIKEMHTMDCEVIGVEEGRNSLKGKMGHIIVKQENGNECGVGSGFTQEKRQHVWDHEDLYVGRIAEIKYQELTEAGIMRFPTFVRWRDDK